MFPVFGCKLLFVGPTIEPWTRFYWYLIILQACRAKNTMKLVLVFNLIKKWSGLCSFNLYLDIDEKWVHCSKTQAQNILNRLVAYETVLRINYKDNYFANKPSQLQRIYVRPRLESTRNSTWRHILLFLIGPLFKELLYDAYYCTILGGAEFCRLRDSILRFETISTYWEKH